METTIRSHSTFTPSPAQAPNKRGRRRARRGARVQDHEYLGHVFRDAMSTAQATVTNRVICAVMRGIPPTGNCQVCGTDYHSYHIHTSLHGPRQNERPRPIPPPETPAQRAARAVHIRHAKEISLLLGYRGIINHVIPRMRALGPEKCGRLAAVHIPSAGDGACRWCRKMCQWKAHWHQSCRTWQWLMVAGDMRHSNVTQKAVNRAGLWENFLPMTPCASCGDADARLTVDHTVPIALAATQAPRQYVRAFLPANLQWLCQPCHLRKTRAETASIKRAQMNNAPRGNPRTSPNGSPRGGENAMMTM